MTLDEILRGWHYMYNANLEDTFLQAKIEQIHQWVLEQLPKKKESEHLGCQQFDENYCFKHENCFDEDEEGMHPLSKQGFNQAIDKTKEIFK